MTFLAEPSVTFPPGTVIDDDTGRPIDPLIEATASAQASAVVRCTVAVRPLRDRRLKNTAAGIGEAIDAMLILDPGDETAVASAVAFVAHDQEYKVVGLRRDAPVHGGDRLLIFGKGAAR